MLFQLIPPPPLLAGYVKAFWVWESAQQLTAPYLYHSMADGMPELIFHYEGHFVEKAEGTGARLPTSYVLGPTSKFSQKLATGRFGVFGVYLYPFAIARLLAQPVSELTNQLVDVSTLLGPAGRELEEQLVLATSTTQRLALITAFLQARLLCPRAPTREDSTPTAIMRIIHAAGKADIRLLAHEHNVSVRQLERRFKVQAGFSPRLFSRIVRFQSALNEFGAEKKLLTQIAYECGYYDQAHFIHDFKEFSGVHPKRYFSGTAEGTELRASI